MIYPTLKASKNEFSNPDFQLDILEAPYKNQVRFKEKLKEIGLYPLKPFEIKILQINIGKMCNQTCMHCHVDAGPNRTEMMTKENMNHCLDVIRKHSFESIDLTGGAPELHPQFKWFVREIRNISRDAEIIVRSNLTILNENKEFETYPDFFREHRLTVISSMPCYTLENVDAQRGEGVYNRSISALKALNERGYGKKGSGLELHLVYNPGGTALPGSQFQLERDYKKRLKEDHGIEFNNLYTITNIPINRFLVYLKKSGKYEEYLQSLIDNFNPSAAMGVMCRDTISIAWNGSMYDCDFNQQLELDMQENLPRHVKDFDFKKLLNREIKTGQHCFGCTAGEGSSCQGALDPE